MIDREHVEVSNGFIGIASEDDGAIDGIQLVRLNDISIVGWRDCAACDAAHYYIGTHTGNIEVSYRTLCNVMAVLKLDGIVSRVPRPDRGTSKEVR